MRRFQIRAQKCDSGRCTGATDVGRWKNDPFFNIWPGSVFQLSRTYSWVPQCNPWPIMTPNNVRIWEKKDLAITLSHIRPRLGFMQFWRPSRHGPFLICGEELWPAFSAPSTPISWLTTTRNRLLGNSLCPRNGPSKLDNFQFFYCFPPRLLIQ